MSILSRKERVESLAATIMNARYGRIDVPLEEVRMYVEFYEVEDLIDKQYVEQLYAMVDADTNEQAEAIHQDILKSLRSEL